MPLFGIDAASYQGAVDWLAQQKAGFTFGIEKATQGNAYGNPFYPSAVADMAAIGMVPGAYHFLDSFGSGAQQADWFMENIGGPDGKLLALDVEDPGATRPRVIDWFVEANKLAPGRDFICYTGQTFWSLLTGDLDIGQVQDRIGVNIVLWDAGDGHQPNVYVPGSGTITDLWAKVTLDGWQPYGGWTTDTRLFLQFTDKASTPGATGLVDGDAFLADLDRLKQLAGLEPATTKKGPPAMFVAIHVGTPEQFLCSVAGKRRIPNTHVSNQYLVALGQAEPVPMDAEALALMPTLN